MKIGYGLVIRYKGKADPYKPYVLFEDYEEARLKFKEDKAKDDEEIKTNLYKYHGWNRKKAGGGSCIVIKDVLERLA